ncbi:hypothetical protein PG291_10130 [Riemerella anatipestifer]|nr:hypothetical protein [Riemerella anatipestifer]
MNISTKLKVSDSKSATSPSCKTLSAISKNTMSHNLIQESNESIEYFSNYLSHMRLMKKIYSEISQEYSKDDEENIKDFFTLNDISSLITICHLDLITNSKNLYLAESDWEKIFFIKNTFLVIYETINSFHKHGKFLNSKSKQNKITEELHTKANEMLKAFKKDFKYDSHINKIRNKISGHINENFEEYYDEIIKFDAEKTALMTLAFFKIIGSFQELLNELMKNIKIDTSNINQEKLIEIQEKIFK